jgi:hypothetical protein
LSSGLLDDMSFLSRPAGANDRNGLAHLYRYLARPPIANDRLQELPDGRLALRFKQAWRESTTHIVFTPHGPIEKLIITRWKTPSR